MLGFIPHPNLRALVLFEGGFSIISTLELTRQAGRWIIVATHEGRVGRIVRGIIAEILLGGPQPLQRVRRATAGRRRVLS